VPAAPRLLAPASGSETNNVPLDLSWLAVPYGNIYKIQIDDTGNFSSPDFTYTSDPGALSKTVGPLTPGKWFWRISATNINNVSGPWSSSRSFKIYPSFNTQFNSDGIFEGWEQHPGAPWNVNSGNLQTSGPFLDNQYNSSASFAGATFTDFTYEARIKKDFEHPGSFYALRDVYGLVVRGTPTFNSYHQWQNGYYFAVGRFWGDLSCYSVVKISNGKWYYLDGLDAMGRMNWHCSHDINYSDWNTLKVIAKGKSLKFYINDILRWSRSVSGPASGRLGIFTDPVNGDEETIHIDWAIAGRPVAPAASEQVAPGQTPVLPSQEGNPPKTSGW